MHRRWVPRLLLTLIATACLAATAMLTHLAVARHTTGERPRSDERLAPLYSVPDFQLIDQTGQPFGLKALRGRVWVAHFFYSRCTTICPAVTGQMARLQMFLDDHQLHDVRMVSFTVDPENDTPQKLAEYAARLDVQPDRWVMLTGERAAIWELVERGFKLAVARTDDPVDPITHAASLVLVDAEGRVRAYYHNMNDPAEAQINFTKLVSDLALLRREP